MEGFSKVEPQAWNDNIFNLIGSRNFLLTCGELAGDQYNTMTAGWGLFGFMWGKPVVEVVVRPSRYTFTFIEKYTDFTINFLPESMKNILELCGTRSGRDFNKVSACGLHTLNADSVQSPCFEESEIIVTCKTLMKTRVKPEQFVDPAIDKFYSDKSYHGRYIGEIMGIWKKAL